MFHTTTDQNTTWLEPPPDAAVIIPEIIAILCCVCGFLGNILTIVVILISPKLKRNSNNWFVCNLSIADALFCAFPLPVQVMIYHTRSWSWGEPFCTWLAALKYAIFGTSLMSLCAIALNRYITVVHHKHKSQLFTRCKMASMLVTCWLFPFMISLTAVLGLWGDFGFQPRALSCTFGSTENVSTNSHRIVIYSTGLFLPILFMVFCYTRISIVVYHSRRKIQHWSRSERGKIDHRPHNHQLTRTMLIICALFTVCVAPYSLVGIFDSHINCSECHLLTPMLSWVQISLNPVIYTATNLNFQQAFKRLFCILTCQAPLAWRPTTFSLSKTSACNDEIRHI